MTVRSSSRGTDHHRRAKRWEKSDRNIDRDDTTARGEAISAEPPVSGRQTERHNSAEPQARDKKRRRQNPSPDLLTERTRLPDQHHLKEPGEGEQHKRDSKRRLPFDIRPAHPAHILTASPRLCHPTQWHPEGVHPRATELNLP